MVQILKDMQICPAEQRHRASKLAPKLKNTLAAIGAAVLRSSKSSQVNILQRDLTPLEAMSLNGIKECGTITQAVTYPFTDERPPVANLIGRYDSYVIAYDIFKDLIADELITSSGHITDKGRQALADFESR